MGESRVVPILYCLMFGIVGCSGDKQELSVPDVSSAESAGMPEVVFLTREGCINTPTMLKNLDGAVAAMGVELKYKTVDQSALATSDHRVGYPTPTILLNGRDMFGMPVPRPPFPHPS